MGPYRPVAYRPSVSLRLARAPHPALGQTFDQMLGWPPCAGDICRLVFHAGATVVGIHVGVKESGFLSALGWVIGIGQGIAGLLDIVSLVQRAAGTHPPEPAPTTTPTAQPSV